MSEKLLCVSVDLDGPACYHAIHGLDAPAGSVLDAHYTLGLARQLELFAELGLNATLFAIGRDLQRQGCADALREAHVAGHEIGNHTWSHRYDFSRLEEGSIEQEVERCSVIVERITGEPTRGFRAPGYHIDDRVVEVLGHQLYRYDASVLPSPLYYGAKLAVMAKMALTGRSSHAIAGGPAMTIAPNRPYRMGLRYWIPGGRLPELPCTVVPGVRVPFIGTTLSMVGEGGAAAMARMVSLKRFVGLELHAIDMMTVRDGLDALGELQPDLKVPIADKRRIVRAAIATLLDAGFKPVTLLEATRLLFG
jgi:peptidoglycan/xylan/chitin deacetylase (PgdA/CDA1 family)